jgi:hypothetical protein
MWIMPLILLKRFVKKEVNSETSGDIPYKFFSKVFEILSKILIKL